jgi:hypothetical protein
MTCRLSSQGPERQPASGVGSMRRADCASSHLWFSLLMAQANSDKITPNRCFMKACRYPTEVAEAEDHGDASHDAVATYRPSKVTSNGRIRGEAWRIPQICRPGGQDHFIKRLMACKYNSLGTPRGRYDEHSSKSSLSCETKVYRTSRRKPNFRR